MIKTVCKIIGAVFVLAGIAGFVAPGLAGLHLSTAHNLIHLVSGAAALYFGLAASLSAARMFGIVFGVVYLLLGLAGFLLGSPGTPEMHGMAADSRLFKVIPGVLELGTSDHLFHVIGGIVFLGAALLTRADHHGTARD
ncbi:MAG TPA: hypothetical protein VF611_17450 [Pyrinomonadaceae bacterium]